MFPFKVLEEKFQTIPDRVKEAILSTEVNQKLQDIVNEHRLQFDEGEELTKEIGYVMLGLKSPDNFIKNVQMATGLDEKTAQTIVAEVNEKIFKEIKDSLREIHNGRADTNSEETDDENLDEEVQEKLRNELLQEIERGKEKTTDLIKQPQQEIQTVPTEKETRTERPFNTSVQPQSSEKLTTNEQNPEKKYIIDPYREPLG